MAEKRNEDIGGNHDFWENWTNITPTERKAITATIRARELVVEAVPGEELVAIYIKGSFPRRELRDEGSDVDMVPIVTQNKFEGAVFGVNGHDIDPVMVVPLSLEEFRLNALASKSDKEIDLRVKPDKFLRMIDEYSLVYGSPLNPNEFPIRSDRELYLDGRRMIKNGFIPLYLKGEVSFDPMLKEFFWMKEMELTSIGVKVPHTFLGIAMSDKEDKLLQEALVLRQKGQITKEDEMSFVEKLRQRLD